MTAPIEAAVAATLEAFGETAWYAYAIVEAGTLPPSSLAILPGAAIDLITEGRVAALVSRIPRDLFTASVATTRMADPEWVSDRAAAHHGVILAASRQGACLPLAFGALFSSPDPLRAWLGQREAALLAALQQVSSAIEWSVTLSQDEAAHLAWLDLHDERLARLLDQVRRAGEGTGYLLRRQLDRARQDAARARLHAVGTQLLRDIAPMARAVTLDPLPQDHAKGAQRWTALVSRDRQDTLLDAVGATAQALDGTGLALTCKGPWPAYAFAREAMSHAA
jgi:hypothetical protein